MDAYMIAFRIIHIASAILWAGSAVFFAAFIGPTIEQVLGREGGRFFQHLVRRRKAAVFFVVSSTLTVVAGGFLYWRDSRGLDLDWMRSGFGTGLTVGAVAGLVSWLLVLLVLAPTSYRLTALGDRIASAGGQPAQEDLASVTALQSRLRTVSIVNIAFLAIAVLGMSTARYLTF